MSPGAAYWIAAAILLGVSVILHFALRSRQSDSERRGRRRGLWSLVVGLDGRGSTSKAQLVLWTYAVVFAFLVLLLQGLDESIEEGFTEQYLFLLGIPAAGAVAARAITGSKVANHLIVKTTDPSQPSAASQTAAVAAEMVSDDDGNTDIADFQYLLFNVVALVYFFHDLFKAGTDSLPVIPDTLVALTGVSAFAYLTKKGVVSDVPSLSSVVPTTVMAGTAGQTLRLRGYNLVDTPSDQGLDTAPTSRAAAVVGDVVTVLVGGRIATMGPAADQRLQRDPVQIVVEVPADLAAGERDVLLITASGRQTNPIPITVRS